MCLGVKKEWSGGFQCGWLCCVGLLWGGFIFLIVDESVKISQHNGNNVITVVVNIRLQAFECAFSTVYDGTVHVLVKACYVGCAWSVYTVCSFVTSSVECLAKCVPIFFRQLCPHRKICHT